MWPAQRQRLHGCRRNLRPPPPPQLLLLPPVAHVAFLRRRQRLFQPCEGGSALAQVACAAWVGLPSHRLWALPHPRRHAPVVMAGAALVQPRCMRLPPVAACCCRPQLLLLPP